MRYLKLLIIATLIFGLMINFLSAEEVKKGIGKTKSARAGDAQDKITWLRYDEGLELMKTSSDKHIFIDFTATWCGWCKRMEKEAFSDPVVIKKVNEHFIPVKVWGDKYDTLNIDGYKITQSNLARQYRISGYPAFWFISPENTRIGPLRG